MNRTSELPSLFQRMRIVPIRPDGYVHIGAFDELIASLADALQALACDTDIVANEPLPDIGINLIIGAHLIEPARQLPGNSIVFNLEQFGNGDFARRPHYSELLRHHAVLDYSARNAARIRAETGNPHVQALRIGYRPTLTRIAPSLPQDVDVLFYGSLNPRRQRIIDALVATGLEVKTLFGTYADERDHWIARSKIVLNLHFYEDKVHEIVRTSYLLANRKAVVCECDEDTEIDADLRDAMACVPCAQLVETCIEFVRDSSRRHALEQHGFEVFSRRDQAQLLAEALPRLSLQLPERINLGSGKDWRVDTLNIDVDAKVNPDLVCDLTMPGALSRTYFSRRFGLVRLTEESFDAIETTDVLEHVPDLVGLMTNSIALLKVGGEMRNSVPYDLSYGAWQDPTHVRAFNERSWLYYTDWHWYLGWRSTRFDLVQSEMILSPLGEELRASGVPDDQIFRTPRAVDAMRVVLAKRMLDSSERERALAYYNRGSERLRSIDEPRGKRAMRICLNMIVKNEAHVIERCLRSVRPYIDSWAIVDTGSTDGTQDVIRAALADLPGELTERPWVDFAHNRNEALELARKHGSYALTIDADDVFEADPDFTWGMLDAPGYMLEIVHSDVQCWWRVGLMRLDADWSWQGVIHEVPFSRDLDAVHKLKLSGARIRIIGGGARSLQSIEQKLANDIGVLRQALVDLPDNPRYTFYLAQALRDSGQLPEAIDTYQRRIELGGWFEEVYYSRLQLAALKERTKAAYPEVVAAYLDAFDYRPQRAEAPCELARYLRENGRYTAAYSFARMACTIEPPDDLLSMDLTVYYWRAREELAVASFYVGNSPLCKGLYEELLADSNVPPNEKERMRKNYQSILTPSPAAA